MHHRLDRRALRRLRPHPVAFAAAALLCAPASWGADLPTGGRIAAGTGSIAQTGSTLTVTQTSPKLVTNWQGFDIAAGSTVRFVQPSAQSVALNRVTGGDASRIEGALQANGHVFLINPNGVLFGRGAQVDVGGLVASTLNLADEAFLSGVYRFQGNSTAAVSNAGRIGTADGGSVALLAARVVNTGDIAADRGGVALAAASDVTVDLGGPVKLQIHRGAIDALVDNGGAIRADGGTVLLTARAADALGSAVVNHTGTVRARTLATGERGEIVLLADMEHGTLNAGGTLDATAPAGGNGGFIETSGAQVEQLPGLSVQAGAAQGRGGEWLVDPYNYVISSSAAANIGAALSNGTSVTVTTQSLNPSYGGSGSGSGAIVVSSPITKIGGGDAALTLRADYYISTSAAITSTSGKLDITLSSNNGGFYGTTGVSVGANLVSNGGRILIGGGGAGGVLSTAQSHGIGYATGAPGVRVLGNVLISSGGGDITINGLSRALGNASNARSAGGVYVRAGSTIDSGGGWIYISGYSTNDPVVFGVGFEPVANTPITVSAGATGGGIVIDAHNALAVDGTLGMMNNGNQDLLQFQAPNVASINFRLNDTNRAADFTRSPPCGSSYPNCGTVVISGANQSYTEASYSVVSMAMLPIYVYTGDATRTYDGTRDASDVPLTSLGGPGGFSTASLGTLSFTTASKNVGGYTTLIGGAGNPTEYQSGTYAIAYVPQGTYTITQRSLGTFSATNKVYDGTNAAAVTASGLVPGDAVSIAATGSFAQADVGTAIPVSISAVSVSGADAANYAVPGFGGLTTTADITPATLTYTANSASRTYGSANPALGGSVTGFVGGENLAGATTGTLAFTSAAGTGSAVGSYAVNGGGLTANRGNYVFVQAAGNGSALTVSPAPLTVTANNDSKTYDGAAYSGGNGVSYSGFVNGENASVLTGTLGYGGSSQGAVNAGTYAITPQGLAATNYTLGFTSGTLTVNAAPVNITVSGTLTGSTTKVYDGSTSATLAPANFALTGFAGSDGASVTQTVGRYADANVGSGKLVTATLAAGDFTATGSTNLANYVLPTSVSGSIGSITPATLTVTANPASRSYGAANPAFTGSVNGFVNGESLASATTGTLSFGTTATATTGVGNHAITGSGLSATNYTVVQAAANSSALSITAAPLTATANNASKTYDGQAYSGGNGVAYSGFVNGETAAVVTGTPSYGGTAQGAVNAGSYAIVPSGLSSPNYAISYASGTLSVDKAVLTITADAASRSYGAANPTLSGSVSGFVNGETLASATTGALAFSTSATPSSAVGSHPVTGSGLGAANYVFTQAAGNATALSITPAALTVTAINASKTYDGLAYGGGNGVSYSGFVNGETAAVLTGTPSYGGTAQGAVNAGSYTITPSGLSSSNYALSYAPGTLTVDKAVLTVAADAASRTYGGANPAFTGTVSGFVNGETLSSATTGTLNFTTAASAGSAVGTYPVTGGGLSAANYTVSQAASNAGALTVTPAPLMVTANAASKTYDGLAYTGGQGVSYSGFVNGETAAVLGGTPSYGGTAQGAVNAGSYTITPTGLSSPNYAISYTSGTLTIDKAVLTLTADATSRSYGVANPSLSGSVAGFVNGETLASATTGTLTFTTAATATSGVGRHAVDGHGLEAANYSFTQAAGNASALSITPAALTVTANNAGKTYDGLAYTGGNGVSFSGFVNGETAAVVTGTPSYGGTAQGAVNAGRYTIVPSGLSSPNYALSYAPGTLTVDKAVLTLTADAASRSYGAAAPGFTGRVSGLVPGETLASATTGTLAFTTVATPTSGVGRYAVTGGGLSAANYEVVQASGNADALTIVPAPLTITAHDVAKTYDGRAFAGGAGVGFSGFVNGESAAVLGGALSYGGTAQGAVNAGRYTVLPQGLTSPNYDIRFAAGTLQVDPATLTLAALPVARTYGSANPDFGFTVSGLVAGETLASATTGTPRITAAASAGSGAGRYALEVSGLTALNGNYVFVQAPGNAQAMSITPAPLTVTANAATKTYDGLAWIGGNGVRYSGFVLDEGPGQLQGALGWAGTAQGAVNAGSYALQPQGLLSPNYAIDFQPAPLLVQPATLTYRADAAGRTYGAANPALTGRVTGFVPGETLASATTGTLSFATDAGTPSPVGGYAIVGGGLSARNGNYVFVQAPGNALALTVAPAPAAADNLLPKALPVPNFPDNALPVLANQPALVTPGNLNYVPVASALPTPVDAPATAPTSAPITAPTTTRAPRTARPGVANIPVSSANGPLDVFVLDGGINASAR